jgi:hypothetical protein
VEVRVGGVDEVSVDDRCFVETRQDCDSGVASLGGAEPCLVFETGLAEEVLVAVLFGSGDFGFLQRDNVVGGVCDVAEETLLVRCLFDPVEIVRVAGEIFGEGWIDVGKGRGGVVG